MKKIVLFSAFCMFIDFSYSQRMSKEEYINKYKDLAIKEMKRTGIPASITLAQGLIESGNGNSRLAIEANNHFGIKCHNTWKGKKIYHDDDKKNECFRKYDSAEESYRDHSDYLISTPRYASLFELKPTDYKSWAHGLKKAGYATNPHYATTLIKTIEENKLYLLDRGVEISKIYNDQRKNSYSKTSKREILENNRVKYILTKSGDTYDKITNELGLLPWELIKYNELYNEDDSIIPGQVLYIQPKRKNPEAGKKLHVVKKGENLYSISQLYAIKLEQLEEINHIKRNDKLNEGCIIYLRKKAYKKAMKSNLLKAEENKKSIEEKIFNQPDNKDNLIIEDDKIKFDF